MKKIIIACLLGIILITGCSVKKTTELTDAEKFAKQYSVSKNNPFKYLTTKELLTKLESGSGIIFLADPDNEWCQASAKILTSALKYKNISLAYYYNPKSIRDKNTKSYKKIVKLLASYLNENADNKKYLYLPDIYVIDNGKVTDHNNDLATMSGTVNVALTSTVKSEVKDKYIDLVSKYNTEVCTNSNC